MFTDLKILNDNRVISHEMTAWKVPGPSFFVKAYQQGASETYMAFYSHSAVGAKNQWCERPHFNIQHSLFIISLLLVLVLFKDGSRRFVLVTLEVDMRYSNIKKCCHSSLPEASCLRASKSSSVVELLVIQKLKTRL